LLLVPGGPARRGGWVPGPLVARLPGATMRGAEAELTLLADAGGRVTIDHTAVTRAPGAAVWSC